MSTPTLEDVMKVTPQLSKTDLEYLQEWMLKQPHLPRMDDIDLVPMLARCEYSLERTKETLDKYFTMRTHAPEIFKFRELDSVKEQLKYFYVAPTSRDAHGNHVVCLGFTEQDPSVGYDPLVASHAALQLMETLVRDAPATPGYVFVGDAQHLATAHVTKLTLTLVTKFLTFLQEAAPIKIVAIHAINLNSVVDKMMVLIKPFLSREMQSKMHFHSKNLDELYKMVSKDTLPQDFGGSLPPSKTYSDELVAQLVAKEGWLRGLDARVAEEGRRPGRAKAEGDVFGVHGSFKQLDFD